MYNANRSTESWTIFDNIKHALLCFAWSCIAFIFTVVKFRLIAIFEIMHYFFAFLVNVTVAYILMAICFVFGMLDIRLGLMNEIN